MTMFSRTVRAGLALAGVALLGACVVEQVAEGPNYQAPVARVAPPQNLRAVCYDSSDMGTMHARMVQQEFATATLTCRTPAGVRLYSDHYTQFIEKFRGDLGANGQALQDLVRRKGLNMDVVVTQFANRTANHSNDQGFCERIERAFRWALSPRVSSLIQVPPPYDFAPDMEMFACPRATG
jgi:hypothetical protein